MVALFAWAKRGDETDFMWAYPTFVQDFLPYKRSEKKCLNFEALLNFIMKFVIFMVSQSIMNKLIESSRGKI